MNQFKADQEGATIPDSKLQEYASVWGPGWNIGAGGEAAGEQVRPCRTKDVLSNKGFRPKGHEESSRGTI